MPGRGRGVPHVIRLHPGHRATKVHYYFCFSINFPKKLFPKLFCRSVREKKMFCGKLLKFKAEDGKLAEFSNWKNWDLKTKKKFGKYFLPKWMIFLIFSQSLWFAILLFLWRVPLGKIGKCNFPDWKKKSVWKNIFFIFTHEKTGKVKKHILLP